MKNKLLWIGSVIILILSVFTFIVFGVGTEIFTALFGKKLPAFGSYDGKPIKYEQGSYFANTVAQYVENNGKSQNAGSYYSAFRYAFNQTVFTMMVEDAVSKSGYKVPESAEDRIMVSYFSDENGYSKKLYNQASDSYKESLRKEISESLFRSRYMEDLFGSSDSVGSDALYGLKVCDNEKNFLANTINESRAFNLVSFNMNDLPTEEVVKFAREHADLFTKYDMSVLSFDTKEDAESALKQISSGEITFEDALTLESSKAYYREENGKLSNTYAYQIDSIVKPSDDDTAKNAKSAIKALKKGELSDVIEMNNGYSIFRCDGDSTPLNIEDSVNVGDVSRYIRTYEASYIQDYYMNIAKNFVTEATRTTPRGGVEGDAEGFDAFDDACNYFELVKTEVPAFPLNYGNSKLFTNIPASVSALAGASTNENFLKTAFSMKENEVSEPIVIGKNIVVLQLKEIVKDENIANTDSYKSESVNYDLNALQSAVLSSDKVKNNVDTVYFTHFMQDAL